MHLPENQKQFLQNCCSIFGGLVFLIILFISWDTVEPSNFGLLCNSISKMCSAKDVYESGRHWVWPTYYFIYFPSNLMAIEFSDSAKANPPLKTRTAEGLSLELFLSFQYSLVREQIPDLYAMNNLEYERTFIRIARDTVVQIASTYEAQDYWTKRDKVTASMQKELEKELGKAHAKIEMQNKRIKQFEQEATKITKEIEVLRSETERQVKTINAEASADSYSILKNADAKANEAVLEAEITAYSEAAKEENLDMDDNELNDYIYYTSLIRKKNAKVLVGMNNIQAKIDGDTS